MAKTFEITEKDREAIETAAETLRQVIKGNTAHDGFEARAALRALERITPMLVISATPSPGGAA